MVLLTDDRRWDAAHTAVPGMQPLPRRGDFNTDPTDARFAFEGTFAVLREKFAWSWEICVALCRDLAKASECGRQSESPNVTEQTPLSLPRKRGRLYLTTLARPK
jgi:hypothetical protein